MSRLKCRSKKGFKKITPKKNGCPNKKGLNHIQKTKNNLSWHSDTTYLAKLTGVWKLPPVTPNWHTEKGLKYRHEQLTSQAPAAENTRHGRIQPMCRKRAAHSVWLGERQQVRVQRAVSTNIFTGAGDGEISNVLGTVLHRVCHVYTVFHSQV